jgi:hypothetical protein
MEPKFLRICLFSLALLFFGGSNLFSQTALASHGKASLDKAGKVMLQKDEPLQYVNVLDLSGLDFATEESAAAYFSQKNTQLVTFDVDPVEQVVRIRIELRGRPDWTVEDWNQYLSTL